MYNYNSIFILVYNCIWGFSSTRNVKWLWNADQKALDSAPALRIMARVARQGSRPGLASVVPWRQLDQYGDPVWVGKWGLEIHVWSCLFRDFHVRLETSLKHPDISSHGEILSYICSSMIGGETRSITGTFEDVWRSGLATPKDAEMLSTPLMERRQVRSIPMDFSEILSPSVVCLLMFTTVNKHSTSRYLR